MQKPLIIAHRGTSHFAPENTFAAFGRAISEGAEGLEFDVQIAKDNVPVVIHDFDLKRLAGRADSVKNLTSEELGKTDVGSWFNQRFKSRANESFSAETVPSLESLFAFLKDFQGVLYVELKFADDDVENAVEIVCQIISESVLMPQVKLKSFSLKAIKFAKEKFPAIRTVALFEPEFQTFFRKQVSIFEAAKNHLADEISLHFSLATRNTIEVAKRENLPVTIWTVNRKSWVKRAFDFGLEAVISNNPAMLLTEKKNYLK